MKPWSKFFALLICILLWVSCVWAATSTVQSVGGAQDAGIEGIPTLPGREISPQEMQKIFPAPLGGSAPSIPFMPNAAPLIPVLPAQSTGASKDKEAENKNLMPYPSTPQVKPFVPQTSSTQPQNEKSAEQKNLEEHFRRALYPQGEKALTENTSSALGKAVIPTETQPSGFPSVEIMLGQMLMAGFTGTEVERLSPIVKLIKEGKVGGVYLEAVPRSKRSSINSGAGSALPQEELLAMAGSGLSAEASAALLGEVAPSGNVNSPGQARRLIATLQSYIPKEVTPLWVAVEQEGGTAQALRKDLGFSGLESAARLGQGTVENTEVTVRRVGLEMASLGINFVLGPAGDVNVNPLSEEIGRRGRSFGSDASVVAQHVQAFGRGLLAARIMPCLRNFPGTGSYVRGFASVAKNLHGQKNILESIANISGTWQQRELLPYEENLTTKNKNQGEKLAENTSSFAVQPGLVYQRNFDAMRPVPLSSVWLTGVLREQWGFQGIIVSQDLRALQPFYSLEESVLQSILAGADILFTTEPPALVDAASSPLAGLGALGALSSATGLGGNWGGGMVDIEALSGLMDKKNKNEAELSEDALMQMLLRNPAGQALSGMAGMMGMDKLSGLGAQVAAKPLTGLATQAEKVYATLLQLVKSGRISEARIRQSWLRIKAAKARVGLMPYSVLTH